MNNIFSKIKTPESWKHNLYRKINLSETEVRPKKKGVAVFTAAAASVAVLTLTVSAVGLLMDWTGTLSDSFNDNVSAEKIINEQYQPLDVSASNEQLTVNATAFMGDLYEGYVLLEARISDEVTEDFDKVALQIRTYDESVQDKTRYGITRYYGYPEDDGNGGIVYKYKVRVYPYWINNAIEEKKDILVDIVDIHCFNTEGNFSQLNEAGLSLKFTPDPSKLSDITEFSPGNQIMLNNVECTFENFRASDYNTEIQLAYVIPQEIKIDGEIILDKWRIASRIARQLVNADVNTGEFSESECPVKLYVDGAELPYLNYDVNGIDKPFEVHNVTGEDENGYYTSDNFLCVLKFEPIDFDAAENVSLEINGEQLVIK